ncbi:MAG TPA: acyl-CoA carboxylase epsilon subunit [Streptosporangiaceae bacterium]|nr:acyl-CoA carboxylase epsilon subunit [Streptosporangiaceae bacterium]
MISVQRGQPSEAELAALVAVLAAVLAARASAQAGHGAAPPARSEWARRSRMLRRPLTPGQNGWRRAPL